MLETERGRYTRMGRGRFLGHRVSLYFLRCRRLQQAKDLCNMGLHETEAAPPPR